MAGILSGRIVLITGASGGLGEGVVRVFLEEGARVYGVSRELAENAPHGFVSVRGDLLEAGAAQNLVADVVASAGGLDAVVHLVGGFAPGRVEDSSPDTWDRMMDLNAKTAFLLFRAVLPHFRKTGRGRLLAVGSRAGHDLPVGVAAYAVSKAALHALVKTTAAELKGSAITCNAVLPSVIDTAANRAAMPNSDPARWVQPAAIGRLLAFLASDAAGDVSGALVPVYGQS